MEADDPLWPPKEKREEDSYEKVKPGENKSM